MFVVDTNILLYAADADAPGHGTCRRLIEQWRRQSARWYLCWSIIYEFVRVASHPRVFRKPWSSLEAWSFMHALLAAPALRLLLETAGHATCLEAILRELPAVRGNL